jgi:hypothetical protein
MPAVLPYPTWEIRYSRADRNREITTGDLEL